MSLPAEPSPKPRRALETLVTLGVLGLLAAIAIPNLGPFDQRSSLEAQNQRRAQSVISAYQSGFAAGVNWKGDTRDDKIQSVVTGQAPSEGVFSGKTFQAPAVRDHAATEFYKYIGTDSNGDLFYDSEGKQSPPALTR
jgi:type II secretory pathway pseudopilin PulG